MYIRRATRTCNGKTSTNYVLVESVQTPKGPRQKTICSLGDLSPRPPEKDVAEIYGRLSLSDQVIKSTYQWIDSLPSD